MSAPERGTVRREAPPPASLSTIERIVRYAEKDDLLLYITAVFGVLMPMFMYLLYKHIHAKYSEYSKKKHAQEKLKRRKAVPKIRIYYADGESDTRRAAYAIAENLDAYEPMVVNLHELKVDDFLRPGIALFVLEKDSESRDYRRLCDWMQKMRYEMRRKSLLCGMTYAVLEIPATETTGISGKKALTSTLHKALCSLEAKLVEELTFNAPPSVEDLDAELEAWSNSFIAWFKTSLLKKRTSESESSASEGASSALSDDSDISADEGYTIVNKKTE